MFYRFLIIIAALLCPAAAGAAVDLSFYSKDFGSSFPHAFVLASGTVDSTGEAVDANYGFTARTVSPAILMGSVSGEVMSVGKGYVRSSNKHFTLRLSDAEYRTFLGVVDKWKKLPQPSYSLNRRNCVYFVADVAATLGLNAPPIKGLMKKPRGYIARIARDNQALIAARSPGAANAAHAAR
jgi:hypothetical protein